MNQNSEVVVTSFLVGFLAAVLSFLVISALYPGNLSQDLLDECEKTLPRNQNCVIIAVPEEKIGDDGVE